MADLQKEYDALRDKLIRSTALKDQAMSSLKKDFGCETIEEAELKLTEMEETISEQERKLSNRLRKFKEQYSDLQVDGDEDEET